MRHLLPLAAALALSACATVPADLQGRVETARVQIDRAYATFALIKATDATLISTVPAVAARADQIHAWEARVEAAFAAARAASDVAAAYAALHDAQREAGAVPGI